MHTFARHYPGVDRKAKRGRDPSGSKNLTFRLWRNLLSPRREQIQVPHPVDKSSSGGTLRSGGNATILPVGYLVPCMHNLGYSRPKSIV
jgi:hypothetical protein